MSTSLMLFSALSPAQHHAVEDVLCAPTKPPAQSVAPMPGDAPVQLLNGACAKNPNGTFVWTFFLADRFGGRITLTAMPNEHATVAIRRMVREAIRALTDEQFRMLVGPS